MPRKIGFGLAVLMVILACGASKLDWAVSKPHSSLKSPLGYDNSYGREVRDQTANLNFIDVAAGWGHTCAVTNIGDVYCWGNNEYAQSGYAPSGSWNLPVRIPGLNDVSEITAGWSHTCALTSGGKVKCWGYNRDGELGNGEFTDSGTPVEVIGLGTGATSVEAGDFHTCAISDDGGVKCWGKNKYGQLGDGTRNNSSIPVVSGNIDSRVSAVAAGWGHTCVLLVHGTVKCWGKNSNGQSGFDPIEGVLLDPHSVAGLDDSVFRISADGSQTCAITILYGLMCWGANDRGELGDGTLEDRSRPIAVMGMTEGIAEVSAGWNQTCGITTSGRVKCWGWNLFGQLGDGTTVSRTKPVDVIGLAGRVVLVEAGWGHVCAITEDGALVCWGNNTYSQLGDSTHTDSSIPRSVNIFDSTFPYPTSSPANIEFPTLTGQPTIPKAPTRTYTRTPSRTPNKTNTKTPVTVVSCC